MIYIMPKYGFPRGHLATKRGKTILPPDFHGGRVTIYSYFPGGKTTPLFSWESLQGGKASIKHYYYTKIS